MAASTRSLESASRKLNVLLDRYLEIGNHYLRQLAQVEELTNQPTALTALIQNLERIDLGEGDLIPIMAADATKGQNIVSTQDTLDALAAYRDDILARLKEPAQETPRNIQQLRNWLSRDVREIVSAFPSFTYAWDKIVELSRLTAVPDGRFVLVRDTVSMVTTEFANYVIELDNVLHERGEGNVNVAAPDAKAVAAIVVALSAGTAGVVGTTLERYNDRVNELLESRGGYHDRAALARPLRQLLTRAKADADLLAVFGLEIGFSHWIALDDSAAHRKQVIKSLLYFSKILLAERAWKRAKEFVDFAILLTETANMRVGQQRNQGTAMLECNRFYARHRLGEAITPDVKKWDTTGLHSRYAFLQFVLLGSYQEAVQLLTGLVQPAADGSGVNISVPETEEWPILEEFRGSDQYRKWRAGHG